MGKGKFSIPFSAIGTTPFPAFIRLIRTYRVDPAYYRRCLAAGVLSLVSEPFRWFERLVYDRRLKRTAMPASPVFILGHWRSGTTLLHNAMCQDPQFAFVNTYQSMFPNQFFGSRWLFGTFMRWFIPSTRPADNTPLAPELPQEEEIALGNLGSYGFYNFWYFPRDWKALYRQYVSCETASARERHRYAAGYRKLVAQAMRNLDRPGFISKDPCNTGRIRELLDAFPDARFIYIYRHPARVFRSSVNFFDKTLEALTLQSFSRAEIEEFIFTLYDWIIRDYEAQKALIPAGRLVEVRYEDFEEAPVEGLRQIYAALDLDGFEHALPAIRDYLDRQRSFEKARHVISPEEMQRIATRMAFGMKQYGYAEANASRESA